MLTTNSTKKLAIFLIFLISIIPPSSAFSLSDSILPLGSLLSDGTDRFTFTGKEKDTTGLMYYEARYYNPLFAHFTQADTVIGDVYDPLSLNRYAYARNNPVKYTDPTGHFIDILADIVFIVLDVMDIVKNPANALNWGALGADIGGAATPGVTGAGRAYKALAKGSKVDKTADAIRAADKISDLNNVDNLYDAGRSLNLPWHKRVGSWFDNLFGRGGKVGDAGRAVEKAGDINKVGKVPLNSPTYPGHWKTPNEFGLGGPGEARQIGQNQIERVRLDFGHKRGGYNYPHWNQEYYKIDDLGKVAPNSKGKIEPIGYGPLDHNYLNPQLPKGGWDRWVK